MTSSLTVNCPHCGKTISLDEALTHQLNEQLLKTEREKHTKEMELLKEENAHIRKQKEAAEALELRLRKEKELLEEQRRSWELEKQRQMDAERDKIYKKAAEDASETQRLKDKEYELKIEGLKKALEDAQRKASQGSQQLQGEAMEINLEETLRSTFPTDAILPVAKGVLGADVRHVVKSPRGAICGTILWEFKRTKAWSDGWITKLKQDMLSDKANLCAVVSDVLPDDAKNGLGQKDGVWVTSPKLIIPLAMLLRKSLYDVARQKSISQNRQTKAEALYSYVTSHEFAQQVESMVTTYQEMRTQIDRERMALEKSWKQREAQVTRLMNGISGIYGSIQDKAGPALPQIKNLELPDSE